jgi:hypothetical protein
MSKQPDRGYAGQVVDPHTSGALVGTGIFDVPTGRLVDPGDDLPNVGVMWGGRPASKGNVRLARKFFAEVDAKDLGSFEGYLVDRGSGCLFKPCLNDPLLATSPGDEPVSFFSQVNGVLVFAERSHSPSTLEELEEARRAEAERVAAEEEATRGWREKQPPVVVAMSDVHPNGRFELTLREAARRLLEAGGEISRGPYGEVKVEVPSRLVRPDGAGMSAVLEVELRRDLVACAEVVTAGAKVIAATLDEVEAANGRAKKPKDFVELVPDRKVSLGGGCT